MKFPFKTYVLLFFCASNLAFAQQFPQFSQYIYNTISINPAFAGSREVLVVNLLNRNQWVGVNGAPETQTFTAHAAIPFTKLGVGLSILNDELGYERNTNIFADVSYRLDLDNEDKYKLTFGIKAGVRKYSVDDEIFLDPATSMDPFLNMIDTKWRPNIGAGVYFRGESFYLGLSTPKFFNYSNNSEFASLDRTSLFFTGGYLWEINKFLKFKPTFLVKYTDGAPWSYDVSTLMLINENIWAGLSYRLSDAIGALVSFKIIEGLSIGYSYEYITSSLSQFTSGSHELMINYEFKFPKPRCKCKHLYN